MPKYTPLSGNLVVERYFDPDKIGSIFIPEYYKNPESQQGIVVAIADDEKEFKTGDYVLFRPYKARREWYDHENEKYLAVIFRDDVVGTVVNTRVHPRKDYVLIIPIDEPVIEKKGSILAPERLMYNSPFKRGTVIETSSENKAVKKGDTVALPHTGGYEIGFVDTVYYLIKAEELLGVVP